MTERARGWCGRIVCAAVWLGLPAQALAQEAEHGGGGLISIDKSLAVQMVNFLLLLLLLWRLLYKPFVGKMHERAAVIKQALEEAQLARAEAERQQEEHAARLRTAYSEAQTIRDAALKEAADEQRKLVAAARVEARRLVESGRVQMEADIRRAREELRREVGDLATSVAERLIKRSLRDEDHRKIVAEAIASLSQSTS
ncbi:MAG: ATP synthase F0 subunit B [Candidatus Rokuibacteriota bacterium]|nr:MAG: ATP synthase F0 subunit B [Candidatus Rokubacteria bacterium]